MGEKSRAQGNSSDPRGSQQGRGASSVTRETAGQHCICKVAYYERQGWDSAPLRARQEELRMLAAAKR